MRQLYSRLGFSEPVPSILDRKGETMQVMRDALGLPNFTLPPTAVEVSDEENRDQFRIGLRQIFANLRTSDDLEDAQARTQAFFEIAVEHLQPLTVDAINVRTCDIAPAESFEGLRDRLNEKLVRDFSELANAIGIAPSDSAWVQEFDEDGVSGRVQFGPMRREELAGFLEVPERNDDPPNMLFLLVDANFKSEGASRADATERWQKAVERQRGIVSRIGAWLKEMVA